MVASKTLGGDKKIKKGRPNPAMEMCLELNICPDLLLAGIAAAAAGAFFFLYQAITMAGRRRKRSSDLLYNVMFINTIQMGMSHIYLYLPLPNISCG